MQKRLKANSEQYFFIFIIFSFAISLLGYLTNNYVQSVIKQNVVNELSYITEFQKGQIKNWLKDSKQRLNFYYVIPQNENPVYEMLNNPKSEEKKTEIKKWMRSVQRYFNYDNILLYSNKKELVEGVTTTQYPLKDIETYLDSALKTKKILYSDLVLIENKAEQLLFLPVIENERIKGVLAFSTNPEKFIKILLTDVPQGNKSLETILFKLKNDTVIYLNKLKHANNLPLKSNLSIGPNGVNINMQMEKDANNNEYIEYVDYRGVNVIGKVKHIKEMDWYIIAKIDKNEVFKVKNLFLVIIIAFFSVIIISGGAIIYIFQRKNFVNYYKEIIEKEEEKKIIEKKYETLTKFANIIIILTNESHKIIEVNEKAVSTYGYTYEEFKNLYVKDLISDNDANIYPNRVGVNDFLGGEYFEGSNKRKDGTVFSVELSITQIFLDGKKHFQLIIQDITERKQMIMEIKKSLSEKDVLLSEIHHRVKNNLNIIYSLLTLQTMQLINEESKTLFDEAKSRIKSMALVHEQLYESKNFAKLNVENYIKELVNSLLTSYGYSNKYINSNVHVGTFYLNIDTLIPLGLILNELITNSIKYAFESTTDGEVTVKLSKINDEEYELYYHDNGKGLPENFNPDEVETLGLSIVKDLTLQLDGKLKVNNNSGAEFSIIFKEA